MSSNDEVEIDARENAIKALEEAIRRNREAKGEEPLTQEAMKKEVGGYVKEAEEKWKNQEKSGYGERELSDYINQETERLNNASDKYDQMGRVQQQPQQAQAQSSRVESQMIEKPLALSTQGQAEENRDKIIAMRRDEAKAQGKPFGKEDEQKIYKDIWDKRDKLMAEYKEKKGLQPHQLLTGEEYDGLYLKATEEVLESEKRKQEKEAEQLRGGRVGMASPQSAPQQPQEQDTQVGPGQDKPKPQQGQSQEPDSQNAPDNGTQDIKKVTISPSDDCSAHNLDLNLDPDLIAKVPLNEKLIKEFKQRRENGQVEFLRRDGLKESNVFVYAKPGELLQACKNGKSVDLEAIGIADELGRGSPRRVTVDPKAAGQMLRDYKEQLEEVASGKRGAGLTEEQRKLQIERAKEELEKLNKSAKENGVDLKALPRKEKRESQGSLLDEVSVQQFDDKSGSTGIPSQPQYNQNQKSWTPYGSTESERISWSAVFDDKYDLGPGPDPNIIDSHPELNPKTSSPNSGQVTSPRTTQVGFSPSNPTPSQAEPTGGQIGFDQSTIPQRPLRSATTAVDGASAALVNAQSVDRESPGAIGTPQPRQTLTCSPPDRVSASVVGAALPAGKSTSNIR